MAESERPVVVTRVSPGQVRVARLRVARDAARGRATPERILRLAQVVLPGEHTPQPG